MTIVFECTNKEARKFRRLLDWRLECIEERLRSPDLPQSAVGSMQHEADLTRTLRDRLFPCLSPPRAEGT